MAAEKPDAVAGIVERYSADADMLIPMMQDVQAEHGYLPREELKGLARALGVPVSRIYSIATFYASFRLMPKGDHTISLCMGTVCFLKGASKISEAIQEEFGLVAGGTSPDGKFTFSPVNCVGACALAPVMVLDGEYHGALTVDSAVELLREVAAGGEPEGADEGVDEGADEGARAPTAASEKPTEERTEKKGEKKAEKKAEKKGRKKAKKAGRSKTAKTAKTVKKSKKKGK